jgi:hypothetical protein
MQCHTQYVRNDCFAGYTASSSRRAGRSFGHEWITGLITTVRDGQRLPKAVAVTRVSSSAWVWYSECISSDRVVN